MSNEFIVEEESYFGVSEASTLNFDLHYALLLVCDFMLSSSCIWNFRETVLDPWNRTFFNSNELCKFGTPLIHQQLSKLLSQLNVFVETSKSWKQRTYRMSIILFYFFFIKLEAKFRSLPLKFVFDIKLKVYIFHLHFSLSYSIFSQEICLCYYFM